MITYGKSQSKPCYSIGTNQINNQSSCVANNCRIQENAKSFDIGTPRGQVRGEKYFCYKIRCLVGVVHFDFFTVIEEFLWCDNEDLALLHFADVGSCFS